MSAVRLRRPVDSSTFFKLVEFAFEAGEGVESADVGVAGFFQEGLTLVEGHAAGGGRGEGVVAW